jgi:hypothetical protein
MNGASLDIDHFIHRISSLAANSPPDSIGTISFILRLGEEFANIRLQDLYRHPLRFLLQVNQAPALRLGASGFAAHLIEGPYDNIARHYSAFVFVGFWLPMPLALLTLWIWEGLSFIRYAGHWSQPDIRSGLIGLRHGRLVRQYGPTILPGLIAGELAENRKE